MIPEKAEKHTMLRWLQQIYLESLEVYKDKSRAWIAILLTVSAVVYHYLLVFLPISLLTAEDYSVFAVWMILVPISGMVLVNYQFVMKPILTKKRMRNGKNGVMKNERE
jgi:hypothetical protein